MHRRQRSTDLLHWLAALALPLALIAGLLPVMASSAAAQQSGTTLTWRVYTCPTDYAGTDYLADCTPDGTSYDIALSGNAGAVDQQGSTDANGYVTFTGLPAGDITSTLGVPGDFAHFYVACFDTTSGSEVFLFDGTGNQTANELSGAAGSSVSCRWYVIPENASGLTPTAAPAEGTNLSFQVYTCPVAYTGDAYLNDCDPAGPGIDVALAGNAGQIDEQSTTDESSFATFSDIPAGATTATLAIPGDTATFYSACFDTSSGAEAYLFDGNGRQITTDNSGTPGSSIGCRWYIIPENLSGQTPVPSHAPVSNSADVRVYICPVGYTGDLYLHDCSPTTDPVPVSLNTGGAYDPSTASSQETDDEGRVAFGNLFAGAYTLSLNVPGEFADFYLACFDTTSGSEQFLSDAETNTYSFTLAGASSISCRWYIIPEDLRGGSPTPTAAPSGPSTTTASASAKPSSVVALPNTGSGSTGGSAFPFAGLTAALVAMAALIASAVFVIGRRSSPRA